MGCGGSKNNAPVRAQRRVAHDQHHYPVRADQYSTRGHYNQSQPPTLAVPVLPTYEMQSRQQQQSFIPYVRRYACSDEVGDLPTEEQARGVNQGMPKCKFLLTASKHLARDYVLIVDRSGSMAGKNWAQAREAVVQLAPYICRFDPDGVDLYFFDHEFVKMEGVTSAVEVTNLFGLYPPRGSTNLAAVLDAAFERHFSGSRGATTILVVTDGSPDNRQAVENVIVRAAGSLERDAELSISFIQVGHDTSASRFLERLDDDLSDAKFDIVDTVTVAQCKGMSFNELIANSIYD